jgi:hypothetical protein
MSRADRRKRKLILTGAFLAGFGAGMAPLASALGGERPNFGGPTVQTSAKPTVEQRSARTAAGIANSAGAFERLSPDDKTIARALMDAETLQRPDAVAWSLDRIAATRQSASGWPEVFAKMRADGVMRARSLRQVATTYLGRASVSVGSDLVLTTAAGDHIPVDTHTAPSKDGTPVETKRLAAQNDEEAARIAAELGDASETQDMAPASGPDVEPPGARAVGIPEPELVAPSLDDVLGRGPHAHAPDAHQGIGSVPSLEQKGIY